MDEFGSGYHGVQELKADTYVYHYAELNRKTRGTVPGLPTIRGDASTLRKLNSKSKEVRHYLKSIADYPWSERGNVGRDGLYVATDPVASQKWGGPNDGWVLIRIKVPAGTRFLSRDMVPRADKVREIMRRHDCVTANFGFKSFDQLYFSIGCPAFFKDFFNKSNISGFYYEWWASDFEGCKKERFRDRLNTLVLLGSSLVSDKNIAVFTATNFKAEPNEDPSERLIIQELFKDPLARVNGDSYDRSPPRLLWPSLKNERYPAISEWKAQHLIACEDAGKAKAVDAKCVQKQDSCSPSDKALELGQELDRVIAPILNPTNPTNPAANP